MPQFWDLDNDDKVRNFNAHVSYLRLAGKKVRVEILTDEEKQRTPTQNRCMRQWHKQCADDLRAAGLDLRQVLRSDAEIPMTASNFMENIWRPVQLAMTGKDSSKLPTTKEYSDIYEVIVKHMAETQGITLPPWPSRFNHEEQKE